MAINLTKSTSIDLTKKNPGLNNLHVGLGWDASDSNGNDIDCDVSVFMLNDLNKIPNEGSFVFYNNLKSGDGSIVHQGDNRTGEGEGDDEEVIIDLAKVSENVLQMLFVVTIHEADSSGQDFSMVQNAFIRVSNNSTGEELCRYELNESFSDSDSVQIGRVYRYDEEWSFEAMGDGFSGGLETLLDMYN
ncbi:MAG TPA: chemical-damaging agent resistance protein C [Flavobacteriales bacterium]|nr:chemical-damaging agent resistance protein C [Flavobacteriales bacterium]